ncbi:hypothetical protein [Deferrisoma sp.]
MPAQANHAAHEELLRALAGKEESVGHLASRIRGVEAKIDIAILVVKLWLHTRSVTKLLDRAERQGCIGCSHRCGFVVQKRLTAMARNLRRAVENPRFALLPAPLRRLWLDACHRIEDKLETYWIASDDEILDLAGAVADKMKRRHAAGGV